MSATGTIGALINQGLRSNSTQDDILKKLQEEAQKEAQEAAGTAVQNALPGAVRPRNLMEHNFASQSTDSSRYLEASIEGLRSDKSMAQKLNSILAVATAEIAMANIEEAGGHENLAVGLRYQAMARAQKHLNYTQSESVVKEAQRTYLKENKENLEKRTQEAMAPKDANGNPILPENTVQLTDTGDTINEALKTAASIGAGAESAAAVIQAAGPAAVTVQPTAPTSVDVNIAAPAAASLNITV